MKNIALALLSTAAFVVAVPAFADSYTFTLSNNHPTVTPGSSYTFSGVLSAPITNGNDLTIAGETVNGDAPLSFNTDAFNNLPFTLGPGDVVRGDLFTVTLPGSATGSYIGSVSLELDAADGTPVINTADFRVTVGSTAVTPEPGSWMLLSTGIGAGALLRRRWAAR